MNLGYVALGFGLLLLVGIAFPGLLVVLAQIVPKRVADVADRLELAPRRCFGVGMLLSLIIVPVLLVLTRLPSGAMQLLGWLLVLMLVLLICVAAAGLAMLLGKRMLGSSAGADSQTLLRGAVALELAVVMPFLGWFLLAPLLTIWLLGALWLAWRVRPRTSTAPVLQEAGNATPTP
jgi:hypothetical protein